MDTAQGQVGYCILPSGEKVEDGLYTVRKTLINHSLLDYHSKNLCKIFAVANLTVPIQQFFYFS